MELSKVEGNLLYMVGDILKRRPAEIREVESKLAREGPAMLISKWMFFLDHPHNLFAIAHLALPPKRKHASTFLTRVIVEIKCKHKLYIRAVRAEEVMIGKFGERFAHLGVGDLDDEAWDGVLRGREDEAKRAIRVMLGWPRVFYPVLRGIEES